MMEKLPDSLDPLSDLDKVLDGGDGSDIIENADQSYEDKDGMESEFSLPMLVGVVLTMGDENRDGNL